MKFKALFFLICSSLGCFLSAGYEAIPGYVGGAATAGYAPGGAGFAFTPQTNILVTALGFGGAALGSETYRVTLWSSNHVPLVSTLVTSNSPVVNQTHYEAVLNIMLEPGKTYYVSAVGTNSGLWVGNVITMGPPNPNGTFWVDNTISYLAYAAGTNAAGFPAVAGTDSTLLCGANFQFETGPIIVITGMAVINHHAEVAFKVYGSGQRQFSLLESADFRVWSTNSASVLTTNIPGFSYTFSVPADAPSRFYCVRSP
jgi:hypothetical protein